MFETELAEIVTDGRAWYVFVDGLIVAVVTNTIEAIRYCRYWDHLYSIDYRRRNVLGQV